jgi:hypothetical protein
MLFAGFAEIVPVLPAAEMIPVLSAEIVPVLSAEIVPVLSAEIVPVLSAEIVPVLSAEIVPDLAEAVTEQATTNMPAKMMDLTFFIVFAPSNLKVSGSHGRL